MTCRMLALVLSSTVWGPGSTRESGDGISTSALYANAALCAAAYRPRRGASAAEATGAGFPRPPRPRPAGARPAAITASAPTGIARDTMIRSPRSMIALLSGVIAGHRGSDPPLGSPVLTKFATYDES